MTTQELIQLVNYGASIVIDSNKPTQDLVQIANYASAQVAKGVRVTIKKAGQKSMQELTQIVLNGKSAIVFDFVE